MTLSACVMIRRCLDCWRQGGSGLCGFTEPDGPLREAMACGTREPLCYCRFVRPVDRPCARSPPAEKHRARHGFEREPDPWRAGDERLERALCLCLLSPAVRIQPVR